MTGKLSKPYKYIQYKISTIVSQDTLEIRNPIVISIITLFNREDETSAIVEDNVARIVDDYQQYSVD